MEGPDTFNGEHTHARQPHRTDLRLPHDDNSPPSPSGITGCSIIGVVRTPGSAIPGPRRPVRSATSPGTSSMAGRVPVIGDPAMPSPTTPWSLFGRAPTVSFTVPTFTGCPGVEQPGTDLGSPEWRLASGAVRRGCRGSTPCRTTLSSSVTGRWRMLPASMTSAASVTVASRPMVTTSTAMTSRRGRRPRPSPLATADDVVLGQHAGGPASATTTTAPTSRSITTGVTQRRCRRHRATVPRCTRSRTASSGPDWVMGRASRGGVRERKASVGDPGVWTQLAAPPVGLVRSGAGPVGRRTMTRGTGGTRWRDAATARPVAPPWPRRPPVAVLPRPAAARQRALAPPGGPPPWQKRRRRRPTASTWAIARGRSPCWSRPSCSALRRWCWPARLVQEGAPRRRGDGRRGPGTVGGFALGASS